MIKLRKLHYGYGRGHERANFRIHKDLKEMSSSEREEYELNLKQRDEKRYNSFKVWQKRFMEKLPAYKIEY